jgi:dUTP pyrophosphatase
MVNSTENFIQNLLNIYGRYMHMKLFVDAVDDPDLLNAYTNAVILHNSKLVDQPDMVDAGFDILTPAEQTLSNHSGNKVDFKVVCACRMVTVQGTYNTGFYMYPRSSISKTPLRLANNVGIIDAGYRGHLIGMFDLRLENGEETTIHKYNRYLQVCAPGLVPIVVELVSSLEELGEETARGNGGFGSTGI